uniref:Uncharacterized protein n=1 Tax=Mus spicilegus TaxID=10103 RepID=A0A8C6I507_MUSSI
MFKRMEEFWSLGLTLAEESLVTLLNIFRGKKKMDTSTSGTVSVKPSENEHMSTYMKMVQLKLHESHGTPTSDSVSFPKSVPARHQASVGWAWGRQFSQSSKVK